MPRLARPLRRFAPPVIWMAVITVLSSSLLGADRTADWTLPALAWLLPWAGPEALAGLHTGLRKLGHLVEYGVLATLWRRALAPGRAPGRTALWAIGLSALYAGVDEARQGLVPNRSPALWDVALDTLGAALAVAWLEGPGPRSRLTVRLARWATLGLAATSLAVAALEWQLGLAAWDLALAGLGLAAAGWGLAGLEGRSRPAR